VAIVVDVLRATTVMAHALAAGCREIIPCAEIEEARAVATCVPEGMSLLAGERGGLPIEGFDLGNSPEEFTPEVCLDKTIVMTTTNGTRAILASLEADHVYVAGFVNLSATVDDILVQFLKKDRRPAIHIVCAGSEGRPASEDDLLAGALADRLASRSFDLLVAEGSVTLEHHERNVLGDESPPTPASRAVMDWRLAQGPSQQRAVLERLRESEGGTRLEQIGREADVVAASKIDVLDVVGKLGRKPTRISRV
jgi:2-phosphosulfolactate phosphatase